MDPYPLAGWLACTDNHACMCYMYARTNVTNLFVEYKVKGMNQ